MMPIRFRVLEHAHKPGVEIVEVWKADELIGVIYPTSNGVKIVSKYFPQNPKVKIEPTPPPTAVVIQLKE